MAYASISCEATKTLEETGKVYSLEGSPKYVMSSIFPSALKATVQIALPNPEQLISTSSEKYDSALPFQEYAIKVYDGTGLDASGTILIAGDNFSSTSNIVNLKQAQYTATYTYIYSAYEGVAPQTKYIYTITYKYQFYAVKNKYPTKPWTIKSVVERILDLAEPLFQGQTARYKLDPAQAEWLDSIRAPEFTLTRDTLREQLRVVGAYIHAEPRLIIRYHKDTDTYEGGVEFRHVILT